MRLPSYGRIFLHLENVLDVAMVFSSRYCDFDIGILWKLKRRKIDRTQFVITVFRVYVNFVQNVYTRAVHGVLFYEPT